MKKFLSIILVLMISAESFAIPKDNELVEKTEFDKEVFEFNNKVEVWQKELDMYIDESISRYMAGLAVSKELQDYISCNEVVTSYGKDNPYKTKLGSASMDILFGWFWPIHRQEWKDSVDFKLGKEQVGGTHIKNEWTEDFKKIKIKRNFSKNRWELVGNYAGNEIIKISFGSYNQLSIFVWAGDEYNYDSSISNKMVGATLNTDSYGAYKIVDKTETAGYPAGELKRGLGIRLNEIYRGGVDYLTEDTMYKPFIMPLDYNDDWSYDSFATGVSETFPFLKFGLLFADKDGNGSYIGPTSNGSQEDWTNVMFKNQLGNITYKNLKEEEQIMYWKNVDIDYTTPNDKFFPYDYLGAVGYHGEYKQDTERHWQQTDTWLADTSDTEITDFVEIQEMATPVSTFEKISQAYLINVEPKNVYVNNTPNSEMTLTNGVYVLTTKYTGMTKVKCHITDGTSDSKQFKIICKKSPFTTDKTEAVEDLIEISGGNANRELIVENNTDFEIKSPLYAGDNLYIAWTEEGKEGGGSITFEKLFSVEIKR